MVGCERGVLERPACGGCKVALGGEGVLARSPQGAKIGVASWKPQVAAAASLPVRAAWPLACICAICF